MKTRKARKIKCGTCRKYHTRIEAVRACSKGYSTGPCDWLYWTNEWDEDGQRQTAECGAESWTTDRGWECANGHEHVREEVCIAEGWRYADSPQEAARLRGLGIQAVGMDGGSI